MGVGSRIPGFADTHPDFLCPPPIPSHLDPLAGLLPFGQDDPQHASLELGRDSLDVDPLGEVERPLEFAVGALQPVKDARPAHRAPSAARRAESGSVDHLDVDLGADTPGTSASARNSSASRKCRQPATRSRALLAAEAVAAPWPSRVSCCSIAARSFKRRCCLAIEASRAVSCIELSAPQRNRELHLPAD